MKHKFKVGEMVEQIEHLYDDESPLCRIESITNAGQVMHKHLNKDISHAAGVEYFRRIPKLRRILKYGV